MCLILGVLRGGHKATYEQSNALLVTGAELHERLPPIPGYLLNMWVDPRKRCW